MTKVIKHNQSYEKKRNEVVNYINSYEALNVNKCVLKITLNVENNIYSSIITKFVLKMQIILLSRKIKYRNIIEQMRLKWRFLNIKSGQLKIQ